MKSLSRVQLFATSWTVAYQASPSMGLSRQEYWSGLPFPSPGDLPDPGIKPRSLTLQADSLPLSHRGGLLGHFGGGGLVAKLCPTLVIPWTVAHQVPLSMGFSRQVYQSGLPFLPPGDLLDQ